MRGSAVSLDSIVHSLGQAFNDMGTIRSVR